VSFDYLEGGWFSDGDDLQRCKQQLVHMIDARLQSADVLPFVVQLPQEFIDEHAKVCVKFELKTFLKRHKILRYIYGGCITVFYLLANATVNICVSSLLKTGRLFTIGTLAGS